MRYTPDEVHEYTADSLPPIEPQFSEKGMIWLQVHGLKETETVRQVCDRFGIDFLVMQDILNADHPDQGRGARTLHARRGEILSRRGGDAGLPGAGRRLRAELHRERKSAFRRHPAGGPQQRAEIPVAAVGLPAQRTAQQHQRPTTPRSSPNWTATSTTWKPDCSRRPTAATRAARFRSCATATSNSNRPPCPCATSTRNCSTPTRRCFTRTCAPSSTT